MVAGPRGDAVRAMVPANKQGTKGVGSGASDDPLMQLLKARELMSSQDRLDLRAAYRVGAVPLPAPPPPTLGQFAADCSWRDALKDPVNKQVMRHLRRRIEELDDPMTAVIPSKFATIVLNEWPRRMSKTRDENPMAKTQPRHPFAWGAELTPGAVATAREEAKARMPHKPIEGTSLWCKGWGAIEETELFDFQYSKTHNPRGGGWPNPLSAKEVIAKGK